jgi:hypothetical protein
MTKYSFRLSSRRFLQELFMDITYSELYDEAYRILGMSPHGGPQAGGNQGASGTAQPGGGNLAQLDEINSEENLAKNPTAADE